MAETGTYRTVEGTRRAALRLFCFVLFGMKQSKVGAPLLDLKNNPNSGGDRS